MKAKAVPDQNKLRSVFDYLPETGDVEKSTSTNRAASGCLGLSIGPTVAQASRTI